VCVSVFACAPAHSLVDQLGVSVYLPPLCAVLWGDDGARVRVCLRVCEYVCVSCVYVCV